MNPTGQAEYSPCRPARIYRLFSVGVVLLVMGWNGFAVAREPANWDAAQWRQWRDREIATILKPTFATNGEHLLSRQAVISKSARAYSVLAGAIAKNPALLTNAKTLAGLKNFLAFTKAQHWMALTDEAGKPTHQLGLEIPDADYWTSAASELEFPPLLRSQPFLQFMYAHNYQAAYDLIQAGNAALPDTNKWLVLPFRAQFILPVDRTSYGRMLVLIPNESAPDGGGRDKWVLFVIATPEMNPTQEIRSVSIFTVHRPPGDGTKPRTYFSDFLRERDARTGDIAIRSTLLLNPTPSKNCYDCHKSAVLPIRPAAEYGFGPGGRLVEKTAGEGEMSQAVNRRIKPYGLPDFGVQDTAAYGPGLGPDAAGRSDQFIKSASGNGSLTAGAMGKIRDAMNCAQCHDHFAPINFLQAVRSDRDVEALLGGRGMVQTYIEKGWMPPNNNLTAEERTALWKCLLTEYLDAKTGTGLFASWLKNDLTNSSGALVLIKQAP